MLKCLPSLESGCFGGIADGSSLFEAFVDKEGRWGGTAATAGAGGTADSPHHRSFDSSTRNSCYYCWLNRTEDRFDKVKVANIFREITSIIIL